MKKKLEAELMSIAHKILQLKNKSDIDVLHRESLKLYEKLSVLKFVEENFAQIQPTIGRKEVEEKMQAVYDTEVEKQDVEQSTDNLIVNKNTIEEEAFAERTQEDDSPEVQDEDSQDIAAVTASDQEHISENHESFEKEEDMEESEVNQEETIAAETEEGIEQEDSEIEVEEVEEKKSEVLSHEETEEELETELKLQEPFEDDPRIESEEDSKEQLDEESNGAHEPEAENEEEVEVLESFSQEEIEEKELEIPVAFSSDEETQVRTLEVGTAEAIADDEFLQDKPEVEIFDPSERLFKPAFDWDIETKESEKAIEEIKDDNVAEVAKAVEPQSRQFTFDDLLGSSYKDPVFVKPEDLARERLQAEEKMMFDTPAAKQETRAIPTPKAYETPRPQSINDKLSKGIIVGLNDRIAFVKHLFGNSNEDYNRVLSQMLTFNSVEEAKEFIEEMVKPDYKNWEGKEDYEERFMEVIAKKFS